MESLIVNERSCCVTLSDLLGESVAESIIESLIVDEAAIGERLPLVEADGVNVDRHCLYANAPQLPDDTTLRKPDENEPTLIGYEGDVLLQPITIDDTLAADAGLISTGTCK